MSESFEGWAILELLGHRRLGGYLRAEELAGVPVLRIDVPGPEGAPVATQWYSPQALYCLTPTSEAVARAVALANRPAPVTRWELPGPEAPRRPAEESVSGPFDPSEDDYPFDPGD